jgi:hypothetical protein
MTACLHRYGVDPAAEADAAPQWHWLQVPEVAWTGWVLHRAGDILGRVARLTRDDPRTHPAVVWLPLSADGRLIGEGSASAGQARQAVERRTGLDAPGEAAPRVCHRRLPGGGRTEDAEQPESG